MKTTPFKAADYLDSKEAIEAYCEGVQAELLDRHREIERLRAALEEVVKSDGGMEARGIAKRALTNQQLQEDSK